MDELMLQLRRVSLPTWATFLRTVSAAPRSGAILKRIAAGEPLEDVLYLG